MPRIRLTAQHVESLPAVNGQRTDYADTICPGLVLRVSPTGVRSWSVLVGAGHGREARRQARVTIGKLARYSLAEARAEARRILEHGAPIGRGLTVERLIRDALTHLTLADSTRREWTRLADHDLIPGLGSQPAAELERGEVRAFLREVGSRAPTTANRCLTVLRRCYSWAVAEELVRVSPCAGLARLYQERPRDRVLGADELRRLMGALARLRVQPCPHPLREGETEESGSVFADATLLLLLTGVRESAVLGMRRAELHGIAGAEPLWIIPPERAKRRRGGDAALRPHHVPLSPQAVAVVRRRLAAINEAFGSEWEHLFPAAGKASGQDRPLAWSSNWPPELIEEMRAVSLDKSGSPVGLEPADPDWTIHGLRHTIATHLCEQLGVSLPIADLILGHQLPGSRVARIYVRAELLAERRAALCRWAEWLERLAEPAQAGKVLAFG
jgi:integrase